MEFRKYPDEKTVNEYLLKKSQFDFVFPVKTNG